MSEQYIEDAHSDLQDWTNTIFDELKDYAYEKDLEPTWVMKAFLYKLEYKINNFCKDR